MLVLSRHRDEAIMIGDDVKVIIVDIRGDKVRLGIEAPQDVPVHRQEVYETIQRKGPVRQTEKPGYTLAHMQTAMRALVHLCEQSDARLNEGYDVAIARAKELM